MFQRSRWMHWKGPMWVTGNTWLKRIVKTKNGPRTADNVVPRS
jgi:hypothetical protein